MMDTSGHAARQSAVAAVAQDQSLALRFDASRDLT
jgi:hypothetical protein